MQQRHSATHSVGSDTRSRRDGVKSAASSNSSSSSSLLLLLIVFIAVTSGLGFYKISSDAVVVSWTGDKKLTGFTGSSNTVPSVPNIRTAPIPIVPDVSSVVAQGSNHIAVPQQGSEAAVQKHVVQLTEEEVTERSVVTTSENVRDKPKKRMQVAFAITITRDGKFQDGAAVMAYSIDQAFRNDNMDISMIAFVHPNVTTSRPFLERVGYRVIETPTPVNVSAIRGKWLRDHINDKAGCCGAAELIKLYSYRLVEYDWVIHLDADVLIFQSFAELLTEDGYSNRSLIYTTDPNMASYKGEEKLPVQGGFLVIKPSLRDYQRIIDIVMEGHYKGSSAWGGTKIGWFWGGKTIQGVLAYYYQHVEDRGRGLRVDRCIYNTMSDSDRCRATSIDDVKTAHYTVCLKPWTCPRHSQDLLCGQLHTRWHQARKEAEIFYGISDPDVESCALGPKKRGRSYQTLRLGDASLPSNSIILSPNGGNDGPRVMAPLKGAGFVDIDNM